MEQVLKIFIIFSFVVTFSACQPTGEKDSGNFSRQGEMDNASKGQNSLNKDRVNDSYFPFNLMEIEGSHVITVNLGDELLTKHFELFKKYGYEGNGDFWTGLIIQMLEELDPGLSQHITYNPEGGMFDATVDTKQAQIRFAEILSPVFSDMSKLEVWVKKADPARIDD